MAFSFRSTGADIGAMAEHKRSQYGSALAKVSAMLDILYPNGIPRHQFRYVPVITRLLEKICRVTARSPSSPPEDESPFTDITGLGLCALADEAALPMPRQSPVASVVDPSAEEEEHKP